MVKKSKNFESTRGSLRIGNQWNAITIIANSQTNPLKAVSELVENSIDAGARNVHIVRKRRKDDAYLEVHDDGKGIVLNQDGAPDFEYIATHVCDSMKRYLDQRERKGIHGEFGIGLLSFWTLGKALRMASASKDGRLLEMILQRGHRKYTVRPVRGEMATGGTRVVIGPLLESIARAVTADKMQRYLSVELRDRIRFTGVRVSISDRISRKSVTVVPQEFEGERIDEVKSVATAFGNVAVELYIRSSKDGGASSVAVCKDGTRVLRNLAELDPFQCPPWTDGRLEGIVDFPALELAPGTRSGIVADERLEAFVAAVKEIEPQVLAAIQRRDEAETEKASREILRQLQRAFLNALRELPPHEYLFFDIPPSPEAVSPGVGKPREAAAMEEALPVDAPAAEGKEASEEPRFEQPPLPFEPGPLAAVKIRPRLSRQRPGEEAVFSATARDAGGIAISEGIDFSWRIVDGQGSITTAAGDKCWVTSLEAGLVAVEVTAAQGEVTVSDTARVKFLEGVDLKDSAGKGLPSYRLEPAHGESWRSRYDARRNEIVINSAHRDYLASRDTAAKHRRYLGKLYAKEVVLLNFPHESAGAVMDRLIEILVRTEEVL